MNILTDHEDPESKTEAKASSSYGLEIQEAKELRTKHILPLRFKILIIVLILISVIGLGIMVSIILKKKDPSGDSYRETQYNLLVRTEITTTINNSNSTKTENLRVTFFGLDMEGEKYRLLVSKGSFETGEYNKSSTSDVSDIFIYLEVSSKDGKILQSKYKNTSLDETTVNLLTGITHYFVIDQESSWNYSSECKAADKEGHRCTHNSKKKEDGTLVYQKHEKSDDHNIDDNLIYEHFASTRLTKDGTVERVRMNGNFEKAFNIDNQTCKMQFYFQSHIDTISIYKLSKEQIKELNQIASRLPDVPLNKIYSKTTSNKFYEEFEESFEEEEPPECFKPNDPKRALSLGDKQEANRHLLQKETSYNLLSIYDDSLYLNSKLSSKKDDKSINWLCSKHNFNFDSFTTKVLKEETCISSQNAKNITRSKLSKYAFKGSVNGYLVSIVVGSFTIEINARIKVDNTPYLVSYSNSSSSGSKLTIESKVNMIFEGITKSSTSSIGGIITTKLNSNIVVEVVGKNSPFYAELRADTAYKVKAMIWMKNSWSDEKCYSIYGIKFCLPKVKQDNKNHTFTQDLSQDRKAQISIFNGQF